MKKFFFFAIATLGMMVGCQKQEINNVQDPIDDSDRVAVQFGVNVPGVSLTKTKGKGAVDAWGGQDLYVLGYVRGAAFNSTTAGDVLIDNVPVDAPASGTEGLIEVKYPTGTTYAGEPYFYADSKIYDFYGYYVDDAATAEITTTATAVTIPVTIDGTQDIMAAKANPAEDIIKANASISENTAYSAYAARRGVHPTLTFQHMLTRFQFYVVAGTGSAKAAKVKVSEIAVESATAATLQVAPELSLENTTPATKTFLTLAGIDATTNAFTPATDFVDRNNPGTAKTGSSLMVLPGETAHKMKVTTIFDASVNDYKQPITPLEFTIEAADIVDPETGNAAGLETFQAGYQYDVIITVYGPEEVQIKAVLSEWEDGGYTEYDPDKEMEEPVQVETKVVAATANSLTIDVTAPNATGDVEVGTSTTNAPADVTNWTRVVLTKALTGTVTVQVTGTAAQYVHVREVSVDEDGEPVYKYQEADKDAESYVPGDVIVLGSAYIHDAASFYTLPEFYKNNYPWDANTEETLPWLAVWFTPVDTFSVEVTNGSFTFTDEFSGKGLQLLTLNAKELGISAITAGTWTITITSGDTEATATIVVPTTAPKFAVYKSYVVTDRESFDAKLPKSYQEAYPWDEATQATLPWLAVEFAKTNKLEVEVTKEEFSKTFTFSNANPLSLLTLNAEELGTEIVAGEWTLTLNGVETTITVE